MLYREAVKDDVKIRAESLSFLMIFSMLPLIAGSFFIFTIFTQFGMVQEALGNFINHFLGTIPDENRHLIEDYVLRFKDSYLHNISGKSGTLGIFALAILGWVGLQTFNNIDRTINFIWSSDRERPFLEKSRNFIVVTFGAPLVIIASLSVPLILKQLSFTRVIFERLPVLMSLINFLVPVALVFATFAVLYRYVPVRRVRWKSALIGSVFAATCLQLCNAIMHLYFKVGTNTAYGKAAVVPLIGFWIYLVWIIVIVGAELSYLVQNEKFVISNLELPPSFYEAECLFIVLASLKKHFTHAKGPVSWTELFQKTSLRGNHLKRILEFLEEKKILTPIPPGPRSTDTEYTLAQDLKNLRVSTLLEDFIARQQIRIDDPKLGEKFNASLHHWIAFFGDENVSDFVSGSPRS